ncbi:MAG: hypothetical protein GW772_00180 [Flavobacteriia bacterium]|nr:hypothetical protein [Flavobacteriia bacterium]NCT59067.1 hypothetical protein [Flavobacteriia bacterium]
MLTIKKYQALFGLITLLIIQFSIFELHFGIYFLLSLMCFSTISKNVINIVSYAVIILLIAGFSSLFQKPILYDFVKDIAYFTKPIIALIAGYLLAKKIRDFSSFLRTFIYVVSLLSVLHIFKIFLSVDFSNASVAEIRAIGGISNLSEVIALTIIFASFRIQFLDVFKNRLLKKVVLGIIFFSFFLYFSRTMFVSLGLFLLAIFGYLKITSKGLKYGFLALIIFSLFYVYLYSSNFEREKPGLESFLYKLKIAPSEIFTPIRTVDPNNHAYLWDHWRAYEATLAIDQINTPITFFIGKGLGALVDLKFKVYLGDSEMRYIPIIHNGYVLVFFKTGIIGFFIYLLFLVNMYLFAYVEISSEKSKIINNLISGFGVYFFFSSLIISGIYNNEDFYMFFVGALLFFRNENKINLIEE